MEGIKAELTSVLCVVALALPAAAATVTEVEKLTASDSAAGDEFGRYVSVSGDTAVVGACYHDDNGVDSGSAYVFVRSGSSWSEQAKLLPGDGAAGDRFGWSVSVSGDTVVVGAPDDDDNGSQSGSAYIFDLSPFQPGGGGDSGCAVSRQRATAGAGSVTALLLAAAAVTLRFRRWN